MHKHFRESIELNKISRYKKLFWTDTAGYIEDAFESRVNRNKNFEIDQFSITPLHDGLDIVFSMYDKKSDIEYKDMRYQTFVEGTIYRQEWKDEYGDSDYIKDKCASDESWDSLSIEDIYNAFSSKFGRFLN